MIDYLGFTVPIKLRIPHKKRQYSYCKSRRYVDGGIAYFVISYNLRSSKELVKKGYSNYYYNDRAEKLKFLKGNRHLFIRFTLLHELGHAILQYNTPSLNNEINADNFALKALNEYNLKK